MGKGVGGGISVFSENTINSISSFSTVIHHFLYPPLFLFIAKSTGSSLIFSLFLWEMIQNDLEGLSLIHLCQVDFSTLALLDKSVSQIKMCG